ncbi:hypothetical protein [Singulisphaera sp. PoT]|uniref:hypothetical protein n=1 Tax=Singulisphaera sp. PoT TaxID=3411797 RepID=UPI003BF51297
MREALDLGGIGSKHHLLDANDMAAGHIADGSAPMHGDDIGLRLLIELDREPDSKLFELSAVDSLKFERQDIVVRINPAAVAAASAQESRREICGDRGTVRRVPLDGRLR